MRTPTGKEERGWATGTQRAHRAGNEPPPLTSVSRSLPARRSWRDSLHMEPPSVAVFQLLIMLDPLWPHGSHVTPHAALQASLSFTISRRLLKLMSIESVMPSNHPSESALRIRWPKYWNCSFSISSSDEHSGLISFRINWFDLLAIQGTLKSLLQHLGSKEVILRYSSFFMVSILLDTLLLLLQRIHPFLSPGSWVVA